jgi:predicted MFS family arabinose efflux permease
MEGIYLAFGISYLPLLLCLHWVPEPTEEQDIAVHSVNTPDLGHTPENPALPLILFLIAMAFTYINIGAYWTYIELAASDASLDSEWVSSLLVWASLASLLGCFVATVISDRLGVARPLLVTLIIQGTSVSMLALGINEPIFFASLFSFNFLWIFIDVYQMGSIARFDPTGRFAALMPAAQGAGQMIGPNIAATVLAFEGGYGGVFIMCGCASIIAYLLYQTAFQRLSSTP